MVKARVPVLKFFGAGDVVLCDVSVNNTEGRVPIECRKVP